MTVDPVCKQELDPETAPFQTEYDGQAVYFCSEECKNNFEEDPSMFTGEEAA